jgi:hypothetical protein
MSGRFSRSYFEVSGTGSSTPIGNASQGEEIGGHATWEETRDRMPIPLEIVATEWVTNFGLMAHYVKFDFVSIPQLAC